MLPVKSCNPYHGIVSDRAVFRGNDGKSVFKVYYVDIVGRADPSRTEWAHCGLGKDEFLASLEGTECLEGVGCITAFAHITKAFRFGPEAEIVMNVRAWSTQGMAPIDLGRSDGYVEFACLAEAMLAADEFRFWAECETVAEYLARWSDYTDAPVLSNSKLREYWGE